MYIFSDLDDLISVTSSENYRCGLRLDDREEDRESLQSAGVATLPDSSYAGFERVQPPSSTPNRQQVNKLFIYSNVSVTHHH